MKALLEDCGDKKGNVQIGREKGESSLTRVVACADLTKEKHTGNGEGQPEGQAGCVPSLPALLAAPNRLPVGFCPELCT